MGTYQLPLLVEQGDVRGNPTPELLAELLAGDLDFHSQESGYASHNLHSFPAKFPPQLPRKFILALTQPNGLVLDPMVGSGTTVLEAALAGRRGIGIDIDPLAVLMSRVKSAWFDIETLAATSSEIVRQASALLRHGRQELESELASRWDSDTKAFIDYWFTPDVRLELLALVLQIERLTNPDVRAFFEVALSSIIITKSGGVSLALDLAHTRPHRAKRVIGRAGDLILDEGGEVEPSRSARRATKILRSPIEEFQKRVRDNLQGLVRRGPAFHAPVVMFGDAQHLPLRDNVVDLVVTSPPYASNAIDYMRAHKFSLTWLGYPIAELSRKRRQYIGGESLADILYVPLPHFAQDIVNELAARDRRKSQVLHRYYSEMARILQEMHRVLKPGTAAIVVVGNSAIRGVDTQTHLCLAEIGRAIGFDVPAIGTRSLDRDRRMMPASSKVDMNSQIEQRMHVEYVIGFYKPNEERPRP